MYPLTPVTLVAYVTFFWWLAYTWTTKWKPRLQRLAAERAEQKRLMLQYSREQHAGVMNRAIARFDYAAVNKIHADFGLAPLVDPDAPLPDLDEIENRDKPKVVSPLAAMTGPLRMRGDFELGTRYRQGDVVFCPEQQRAFLALTDSRREHPSGSPKWALWAAKGPSTGFTVLPEPQLQRPAPEPKVLTIPRGTPLTETFYGTGTERTYKTRAGSNVYSGRGLPPSTLPLGWDAKTRYIDLDTQKHYRVHDIDSYDCTGDDTVLSSWSWANWREIKSGDTLSSLLADLQQDHWTSIRDLERQNRELELAIRDMDAMVRTYRARTF